MSMQLEQQSENSVVEQKEKPTPKLEMLGIVFGSYVAWHDIDLENALFSGVVLADDVKQMFGDKLPAVPEKQAGYTIGFNLRTGVISFYDDEAEELSAEFSLKLDAEQPFVLREGNEFDEFLEEDKQPTGNELAVDGEFEVDETSITDESVGTEK